MGVLAEHIGGDNISLISVKAMPIHVSGRATLTFHIQSVTCVLDLLR